MTGRLHAGTTKRRHRDVTDYLTVVVSVCGLVALLLTGTPARAAGPYDPLLPRYPLTANAFELSVHDTARDRTIPVRLYAPETSDPAPVVLFSHGLGGSRGGNAFLGEHWARRGYIAAFVQHPGSDAGVWRDKPRAQRLAALRKAANLDNFLARIEDIPAVINQFEHWNGSPAHPLYRRMNMGRIGMSGHSFGAITTQALGGQRYNGGKRSYADSRIRAAIMFSPSSPRRAADPSAGFRQISTPWLLMTGTKDTSPVGNADVASRLAVFAALPAGSKYLAVLNGAQHSAFSDRALPQDRHPRNPNHHRVMLALSTAFWDAFLRDETNAKAWLDGRGPRSMLEPEDRWQHK